MTIALAAVFALLNGINALNKGGDARVFFEGGRRILEARPLYDGSSAADGFIGPPFQALFFAPFAALANLSPAAAALSWYFLNLVCLGLGVILALRAWSSARELVGLATPPWFIAVLPPLLAVLLPLQTNFEHQNMNALLLALIAGATVALASGAAVTAGALIGVATALKAFPALLIVYLAIRRAWTACATSIAVAAALTLLPIGVYGGAAFREVCTTWIRLGRSGWPVRGNNQSLVAAIDRWTGGFEFIGVRTAGEAPLAMLLFTVIALLLAALALWVILSNRERRLALPVEIALITVLAILVAPIAWDHYWTLLFPAFVILYYSDEPLLLGRSARPIFWVAALLTTGVSPLTVGGSGFDLARQLSLNTIAALIVFVGLLAVCRKMPGVVLPSERSDKN